MHPARKSAKKINMIYNDYKSHPHNSKQVTKPIVVSIPPIELHVPQAQLVCQAFLLLVSTTKKSEKNALITLGNRDAWV